MIPTDKFYDNMLDKLGEGSAVDVLFARMNSFGFETIWLLPNLGSLLLFMGLYPLMTILWLFTVILVKLGCNSMERRRIFLSKVIFWNWPISFLKDSFIVVIMCCLYNLVYADWSISMAKLNTGLSALFLVLLILYPALMQLFLYKKRHMLRNRYFKMRYGSAYEGLEEKDLKFLLYPLFF